MRGLLLDVINQEVKVVDVANDIHEWYKMLNCQMVEMPERQIGGKYFTIICDEEGLLKSDPTIAAVNDRCEVMLVGNILIFNMDYEEGDIEDLTEDDIKHIQKYVQPMVVQNKITGMLKKQLMLTHVEY